MDELCPLCLKIGDKRKIKAVQINLTEAAWLCENEECPWPFEYEKPEIFSRKIGEKWGFEWQIYRKVRKSVGPIPISAELSLYTPPVTPSGDTTSKDPTKADLADSTGIANLTGDDGAFSSGSLPRDSYAPRSTDRRSHSPQKNPIVPDESNANPKIVPSDCRIGSTGAPRAPSLPSIFDIDGDGDGLLSDKIGIAPIPADSRPADPLEGASAGTDLAGSETANDRLDAPLEAPPKEPTERSLESKKIGIGTAPNADSKETPLVRSVARTNIDLKIFASSTVPLRGAPVDFHERSARPIGAGAAKPPSDRRDRSNFPRQRTTTITVEGIPPITLSYDLADLGEKPDTTGLPTRAPIQGGSKRKAIEAPGCSLDRKSRVLDDTPKKQPEPPSKRRARHGKQYEKFSFSALRRTTQKTREPDEKSAVPTKEPGGNELARSNEADRKRRESLISDTSCVVASGLPTTTPDRVEAADRTDESLLSSNPDAISPANYSHPVGNLNLGCLLDDMLLDDCRNATKDLNDDWLESFFT